MNSVELQISDQKEIVNAGGDLKQSYFGVKDYLVND
jgi:hypothetical protein